MISNNHWGDDERHLIGKGIQCMYVQTENIIRSKLKIGGWIPCSERLPEKHDVLVSFGGRGNIVIAWYSELNNQWKNSSTDNVIKAEVIAWQPLPEVYHG